jgi:dTDP-4-dehydrorhamnose reductase
MKINIIGYKGHIGREMLRLGCSPLDCDVRDLKSINAAIEKETIKPAVIINLAAHSDVDWCEKMENQGETISVNFRGAWNVSKACEQQNISVVHISTDHIFDGKAGPYVENIIKGRKPQNYYGLIKMAMEGINDYSNTKIIRTSYLFDQKRVDKVCEQIRNGEEFPTFISRSFMYLRHFAESLHLFANRFNEMPKLLNISGSQTVNWYEFALAVSNIYKIDTELVKYRKRPVRDWDGAPRPAKAGLVTTLSGKLNFPQHDYVQGLHYLHENQLKRELGYA